MNQKDAKTRRKTWDHPWRYRESFLIVLELFLLGLIFEVLSGGRGAPLLKWPANLIMGAGIPLLLLVVHFQYRKKPFVKWLSSVPAAVSAILFFAVVVMLLGFIPQGDPQGGKYLVLTGLTHVKNSWLMMVAGIYFLTILGFVAIRRATPFNRKNLGFLLNHAGLYVTIAAGYLGSGDLVRLNITTMEKHGPMNMGMDSRSGQVVEIPFSIRLVDFNIENYNPKIAVMDGMTGAILNEDGKSVILIEDGMRTTIGDWDIGIDTLLTNTLSFHGEYFQADSVGSATAAYVSAVNRDSGESRSGWISCGSFRVMHQHLALDGHNFLVMTFPEPEKYSSDIIIHGKNGQEQAVSLEVNKPYKYKGWMLYQLSYDELMGEWSEVSVIEAVRDPWLPVVYLGIFLLLGGAAYLFWTGRTIKEQ